MNLENKINKQAEEKQNYRYIVMAARWEGAGGIGDRDERIKDKLVVREQSRGCKVQYREQSSNRKYTHDLQTWTMVWGLPEGEV